MKEIFEIYRLSGFCAGVLLGIAAPRAAFVVLACALVSMVVISWLTE